MADQENVLTSLQQYRSEVFRLPRLTDSEEHDLEQRARLGDEQARQLLIESSLQYVASVAWRYVCYVRLDDYLDLVSVGNLAVVEGIAKALTATKPGAYLRWRDTRSGATAWPTAVWSPGSTTCPQSGRRFAPPEWVCRLCGVPTPLF